MDVARRGDSGQAADGWQEIDCSTRLLFNPSGRDALWPEEDSGGSEAAFEI